ncbi:hypothetical protein B0H10DRAFT_2237889 [Mycena sp. CBHHK59/15]|nr:hypothetical protein B0H10DRAFT_2237889 [Mycena sp. CBHHK59/15]
MLVNEDLKADINLHLQNLGKDITAEKLAEYLWSEEVMQKHGITRKITVWTARRYLKVLGYRQNRPHQWRSTPAQTAMLASPAIYSGAQWFHTALPLSLSARHLEVQRATSCIIALGTSDPQRPVQLACPVL